MSLQSSSDFLDNELSTESDRESKEMRIARWMKKYQHLPIENIFNIASTYWKPTEISAAFKLYIDGKV